MDSSKVSQVDKISDYQIFPKVANIGEKSPLALPSYSSAPITSNVYGSRKNKFKLPFIGLSFSVGCLTFT